VITAKKVVVVGLGEIGKPLLQLLSERYDVIGVDVEPVKAVDGVDVMHVCYPFQIRDFTGETARYIAHFRPTLTIIESTVAIGTTRAIADGTGTAVVNSPVRGKHARMLEELRMYTKFVGALNRDDAHKARDHFGSVGLKTKILGSPEATELAKLTETTYFGVLIAWAQEIERYCDKCGQDYAEITSFYEEIKYLPAVKFVPGIIGGHCVMPNIKILSELGGSVLLDAIKASNTMKINNEQKNIVGNASESFATKASEKVAQ
jgi:UDP-N-acetyl-D-mannosaminuronate dehydrogenase